MTTRMTIRPPGLAFVGLLLVAGCAYDGVRMGQRNGGSLPDPSDP
jgi:hypothetical protein